MAWLTTTRDGEGRQSPSLSFGDAPYLNMLYAEPCTDFMEREQGVHHEFTDGDSIVVGELGSTVCFAGDGVRPTTGVPIGTVVFRCAHEKVSRVHTRRVVTGMSHDGSIGYRPVGKFVGNTVSNELRATTVSADGSVSTTDPSRFPLPTGVGRTFGVLGKEPIFEGDGSMTHALDSSRR